MEETQETLIVEPATPSNPLETPDASPASRGGKARMQELTPAKRRALGRKAALARWGKQAVAADATTAAKAVRATRRRSNCAEALPPFALPRASRKQRKTFSKQERVFGIALTAAEKRLATAIEERACAASTWAVLNAEIPSLQRTIAALRNQQNPAAPIQGYEMTLPDGSFTGANIASPGYTLNNVLSDAPVPFVRPAPTRIQAQPPVAASPRPLAVSRATGGAVDVNLEDDPADEEDKFLNDSSVAGGTWH